MGWSTGYGANPCADTNDTILDAAQNLKDTGLFDQGYNYILIDDCW